MSALSDSLQHTLKILKFERASRSLAKTGLFLGFCGSLFLSLFLVRFLEVPGGSFGSQGPHYGLILQPFWSLFGYFLGVGGISEN